MNQHTTLRIDPRHTLVWRSPTSLQLGVDIPLVRFERVSHAEDRMLHALVTGVSLDGLRMLGATSRGGPRSAARLLERVAPALRQPGRPEAAAFSAARLDGHRIALGGGSTARPAVAGMLHDLGAEVVESGSSATGDAAGAVAGNAARAVGGNAARAAGGSAPPTLGVVVSSWFTPPRESAEWLRLDTPHLDVVFSDSEVTVGPLVVPGLGPCLHCRERRRVDLDPSWPAIAGQLIGRRVPTESPLTVVRVLAALAELLVAHTARASPLGRVIHIDAETRSVSETQQYAHPECACRALPGTGREPSSANGSPRSPPTRASVAAAPG